MKKALQFHIQRLGVIHGGLQSKLHVTLGACCIQVFDGANQSCYRKLCSLLPLANSCLVYKVRAQGCAPTNIVMGKDRMLL